MNAWRVHIEPFTGSPDGQPAESADVNTKLGFAVNRRPRPVPLDGCLRCYAACVYLRADTAFPAARTLRGFTPKGVGFVVDPQAFETLLMDTVMKYLFILHTVL